MHSKVIRKAIPDTILKHFLRTTSIPDVDTELNVRAIDIGYGYTKYTKSIDKQGVIECDLFPSIVPLSPQEDLSGEFFVSRDTKVISSGGTDWEVGPGVYDIATKNDVRAMHEDFVKSEQWKVLFLGALAYMDEPEIDFLVLGLPVSNMSKKDEMVKLATGSFDIDGKTYTVKNVLIVPQPLGSLYNYAIKGNNFERFNNTNSLIVDPGYLTFDFLLTKSFAVNAHRSGARPGGMASILNAIAGSIAKEQGIDYDDLNQIDVSLDLKNYAGQVQSRPVWIYGKEVDLNTHIKNCVPVIETSLNFMLNKIGDAKDVAQIIMAGGPNKIFEKSIRKQFPHHEVITLDDGIFGNVVGFMYWGMMVAYGNEIKSKAA